MRPRNPYKPDERDDRVQEQNYAGRDTTLKEGSVLPLIPVYLLNPNIDSQAL